MSERDRLHKNLGFPDGPKIPVVPTVEEATLKPGESHDFPSMDFYGRGEDGRIHTAELLVPVESVRLREDLGCSAIHLAYITDRGVEPLNSQEERFKWTEGTLSSGYRRMRQAVEVGRSHQENLPAWVSREHCVVDESATKSSVRMIHVENRSRRDLQIRVPDMSRNELPRDFRGREPVWRISASMVEKPLGGEDARCLNLPQGIFGVFDGVGESGGGARAARYAAAAVLRCADKMLGPNAMRQPLKETLAWNAQVLNRISAAIEKDPAAGSSTATLARIVEQNGEKFLTYANIGDSRLYIVRDGKACQMTKDDGSGTIISASLGSGGDRGQITARTPWRIGYERIFAGDTILAATDGILGDHGTDVMSDGEISMLVSSMHDRGIRDPEQIAQALLERSRKDDDKTLIALACS